VGRKSNVSVPENCVAYESNPKGMKLEARNLSFSYDKDIPVLKNISFMVEAGQIVSLVGFNGSGEVKFDPIVHS
jgi:ABC-type multidrug transport system fused ATPase/permease subunit